MIPPTLLEGVKPDIMFYIAGVDPHESDRQGRLTLSDEGLAARDADVLETGLPPAAIVSVLAAATTTI